MDGKDAQENTYNCLYGAGVERKRVCNVAALIHAVAPSKRAKFQENGTVPVKNVVGSAHFDANSSNELVSHAEEQEDKCSDNESCSLPKSSPRFLYYEQGQWLDFSEDAAILLSENLQAGKSVAEVFVWGCMHLVNFILMMQINTKTGYRRSIAWIDEKGKCFFPPLPFEGLTLCPNSLLNFGGDDNGISSNKNADTSEGFVVQWSKGPHSPNQAEEKKLMLNSKSISIADLNAGEFDANCLKSGIDFAQQSLINKESNSDTESVVSSHLSQASELMAEAMGSNLPSVSDTCIYPRLADKLVQLDQGDQRYVLIKDKFLEGLGILGKDAAVKAIYYNSHTTPSSKTRLLGFHRQLEVTKQTRGNPNVHYAWHGTSKEGVCGIVLHGFGQPMKSQTGAAFGIGVYLTPEDCSHVSAIRSDYDENSEQHVVLCKVIMGNTEVVQLGSEQYHPSSEDYDTGVDNLLNPKRYIVWSTHMNTNILPLYVVNFKLSPQWHELLLELRWKNTMLGHFIPHSNDIYNDRLCSQSKVTSKSHSSMSEVRPQLISFPLLLSILKSKFPEIDILFLHRLYLSYKAQRISRLQLMNAFRRVVGDGKLSQALMFMKEQVGCAQSLEPNKSDWQLGISRSAVDTGVVGHANQDLR